MRRTLLIVSAALATAGCDRASPPAGQAAGGASPDEVVADPAATPAADGPVQQIDRAHAGEPAPSARFTGADGQPTSVAAFKGRPVLVNLWATWCGPCIKELPTLEALAAKGGVRVIAISQDSDAAKAAKVFAAKRFKALPGFTDAKMQWLGSVTTNLPTTILYGPDGRERWRVLGDLDWTGPVATAALKDAG